MIGNDLVDLEAARRESNWKRKGFMEKIFAEEEREFILQSSKPEKMVWLIWSMKEAAYKAHQRKFQLPRRYNPRSYTGTVACLTKTSASGYIKCGENLYFTQSAFKQNCIYTTASSSEDEKIISRIIPSSESLKFLLISQVCQLYNICEKEISLQKNENGIPVLSSGNAYFECLFSLSHHGRFSACCLSLTNY